MTKVKRRRAKTCLICCMRDRGSSDEEDDFPEIQPIPLDERVAEEEEIEGLAVSRGNISIEGALNHPNWSTQAQKTGLHRGDATTQTVGCQPPQKLVHFAVCHEEPLAKDIRENDRHTPVKELPSQPTDCNEEYVLMKSKTLDDYVKIPVSSFKSYVTQYVTKIVESAMESVSVDEGQAIDVADGKMTDDSDDGIEVDCAEEEVVISKMVDEMLARVVQSLASEAAAELTLPRESKSADSDVSVSTNTGDSVAMSLDWDGYEPLLLREDPSSTDISIRYPEISAGTDV